MLCDPVDLVALPAVSTQMDEKYYLIHAKLKPQQVTSKSSA